MLLLTASFALLYLCLGLLSGLGGGLLGLGGGVVLVPALLWIFLSLEFPAAHLMHMAVTTSLATIAFTAASAAWSHHPQRRLEWPLVLRLAPGISIGSIAGAALGASVPSADLRRVFGVFELLVALQVATGIIPPALARPPGSAVLFPASGGIGFLSTMMGIGGGSLSVPFLLLCGVSLRSAIAVSSACGLPIALAGVTTLVWLSYDNADLPGDAVGYLYWPAALCIIAGSVVGAGIGARLLLRISLARVQKIFAAVLALVGLRMRL